MKGSQFLSFFYLRNQKGLERTDSFRNIACLRTQQIENVTSSPRLLWPAETVPRGLWNFSLSCFGNGTEQTQFLPPHGFQPGGREGRDTESHKCCYSGDRSYENKAKGARHRRIEVTLGKEALLDGNFRPERLAELASGSWERV